VKQKAGASAVFADGESYRVEAKGIDENDEFTRQYPIVISTDGGKTHRRLRPEARTWYEEPNHGVVGHQPYGKDTRVKQPRVTLADEGASDEIPGLPTRKLVLRASFVVETDGGSERLRMHKTRTLLMWVADVSCAPRAANAIGRVRFGYPEIDEPMERELQSITGLIVRKVDAFAERYEGGPPQTFTTTIEVVDPKCGDVDPALFSVPKGYRYQEPVRGGPGVSF